MNLREYDILITYSVAITPRQDVTNRRLAETMHDLKGFVQQQGIVTT